MKRKPRCTNPEPPPRPQSRWPLIREFNTQLALPQFVSFFLSCSLCSASHPVLQIFLPISPVNKIRQNLTCYVCSLYSVQHRLSVGEALRRNIADRNTRPLTNTENKLKSRRKHHNLFHFQDGGGQPVQRVYVEPPAGDDGPLRLRRPHPCEPSRPPARQEGDGRI